MVLAAVLMVGRTAQRDAALAHAVVAATPPDATKDWSPASIVLMYVKPHVPQPLRAVADVDVLEVLGKVCPFHPEEAVIDDHSTFTLVLHFLVLIPERTSVGPISCPFELTPRIPQPAPTRRKASAHAHDRKGTGCSKLRVEASQHRA